MELAMIGLGKMGFNMCRRLVGGAHTVYAFDQSGDVVKEAVAEGMKGLAKLEDVAQLKPPRVAWVMVPAGGPTSAVIDRLTHIMQKGDVIIDGGNSNFKDSIAHHAKLKEKGLRFLDAGTSGGIWGLKVGYCLMIGGEKDAFQIAEPLFKTLAPPDGYAHVGGPGTGHYTKMVHNGIEYGLMQAYAEGFEILRASGHNLDLRQISHLWNQGSVVRSWLLELAERAFERDPDLKGIQGWVADSGEGRWTVFEAIDKDVPAPVITLSLLTRFRSRQPESFTAKVLAALRNEFGGHAVKSAGKD